MKMIALNTLKSLATQKQKDAKVLYKAGRYSSAIYLMGYALELKLKGKICNTLGFLSGFPENKIEFATYLNPLTKSGPLSTGILPTKIHEIKNHDLNVLIVYSGVHARIQANFPADWLNVKSWSPEDRYKLRRFTKVKCNNFMTSARIILSQIS